MGRIDAGGRGRAAVHYLRGTKIGADPPDEVFEHFVGVVIHGIEETPISSCEKVPYNAGLWPISHGGLSDLTFDESIAQGVARLTERGAAPGDVIFGYSQGAVAASMYKESLYRSGRTGNRYVLVENPSRPNGGIMARFQGLSIPFFQVTFSGATPRTGDRTVDVARQYDGWADFPAYLWNPLAVANALLGILVTHGGAQTDLTAEAFREAERAGGAYYQYDADSDTAYYLIKASALPLLAPLEWLLPRPLVAALGVPLRWFIETAYDRTDYGRPTRSSWFDPRRLLRRFGGAGV